jgi:hypothetical protein
MLNKQTRCHQGRRTRGQGSPARSQGGATWSPGRRSPARRVRAPAPAARAARRVSARRAVPAGSAWRPSGGGAERRAHPQDRLLSSLLVCYAGQAGTRHPGAAPSASPEHGRGRRGPLPCSPPVWHGLCPSLNRAIVARSGGPELRGDAPRRARTRLRRRRVGSPKS